MPNINVGSLYGTLINKSINQPVKNKDGNYRKYRYYIYEPSWSDSNSYYDDYFDYNSNVDIPPFNLNYLFLNEEMTCKIEYTYSYTIYINNRWNTYYKYENFEYKKLITKDEEENIEIPFEYFKITFKYINHKTNQESNIPPSSFTLTRNNGDGYDEVYKCTGDFIIIKSGIYPSMNFYYNQTNLDNSNNEIISYSYNNVTVDRDMNFTFYYYTNTVIATVIFNNNNYKIKIYDENENLYINDLNVEKKTSISYSLLNITYIFTLLDEDGNEINRIRKTLDSNTTIRF